MSSLQPSPRDPADERAVLHQLALRIDALTAAQADLARAVATAVDAIDALHGQLAAIGVDFDERARAAVRLAEIGTRPEIVAAAEVAVDLAAAAPAVVATAVDTLDAAAARMASTGTDLDARARAAVAAADVLTDPVTVELLQHARRLAPRLARTLAKLDDETSPALDAVDTALVALQEARPAPTISLWALFRSVSHPGTSRFIAFLQAFAERYGTELAARTDRRNS